jgi:O-antigen ligase
VIGNSRGPFLFTVMGLVGIFFFYFYFSNFNPKLFFKVSFFMILTFFSVVLLGNYISQNKIEFGIIDRLTETKKGIERGDSDDRTPLHNEAIEMFYEAPLFGNQINLKSLAYPHNLFLEILMSMGLFGLLLFLNSFFRLLSVIFNFASHSKIFTVFIVFFILTFGLSMTTGNMYQNVILWNLIAILLSWPKLILKNDIEKPSSLID